MSYLSASLMELATGNPDPELIATRVYRLTGQERPGYSDKADSVGDQPVICRYLRITLLRIVIWVLES